MPRTFRTRLSARTGWWRSGTSVQLTVTAPGNSTAAVTSRSRRPASPT